MTNRSTEVSLHKAAMVAALGLLTMSIFAVGAIYFIFQKLIIPGDAATTANNIIAGMTHFRIGIASLVIVAVCDVVVAWALYVFLKPVNQYLSLLTAWFRLVYAAILAAALFDYAEVLQLLGNAEYLSAFNPEQLQVSAMLSITAVDDSWAIGLIFFGLHLAFLGHLILNSGYIPKILGVLLIIAGFAYMIDSFGRFLVPNYDIGIASFVGWSELLFMFWLFFKGTKLPDRSFNQQ